MKCLAPICFALLLGGLPLAAEVSAQEPPPPPPPPPRGDFTFVWKGTVERGYLGLQVLGMTPELRLHYGAPEDEGVLVARVEESSPAERAGILVGDIVTAVEGESIDTPMQLVHAVGSKREGDVVEVELWRDGAAESVPVSVAERDRPVMDLSPLADIRPLPELPDTRVFLGGPGRSFHFDENAMEALENARKELLERFDSEEWERKLERLQELDVSNVELRMRELEKRILELERELERERND